MFMVHDYTVFDFLHIFLLDDHILQQQFWWSTKGPGYCKRWVNYFWHLVTSKKIIKKSSRFWDALSVFTSIFSEEQTSKRKTKNEKISPSDRLTTPSTDVCGLLISVYVVEWPVIYFQILCTDVGIHKEQLTKRVHLTLSLVFMFPLSANI